MRRILPATGRRPELGRARVIDVGAFATILVFAVSPGLLFGFWCFLVLRRLKRIAAHLESIAQFHARECEYLAQLPAVKDYNARKAARLVKAS